MFFVLFLGWAKKYFTFFLRISYTLCIFVQNLKQIKMATTKTNELSAYTIAKNCSDMSDVNAGMDELKDYFTSCEKSSKKPTATSYIRFSKLAIKRDKLKK